MNFAGITTRNNIFLAPMAGVSDSAFRRLCIEQGAGLCYSEMVSAKAICYQDKKTRQLLKFTKQEQPIVVQLFGSQPDIIAEAIKKTLCFAPAGYDINMGCPTPKIVNNGDGSALLKNLPLASEIVKAAVSQTSLPVSVKMRIGWGKDSINAVDFAKAMEQSGASMICVHGRTREQYYSPGVNLDVIKQVKQALRIPVIGNGDVFTPQDAKIMMDYTGCDAIMIGRGAQGNPWIFREITSYLNEGKLTGKPTVSEKMDMLYRQAQLMLEDKEERGAMRELRKHMIWYFKGMRGAVKYKLQASQISSMEELRKLIEQVTQFTEI